MQHWWLAETWDRYSHFSLSLYSSFPAFPLCARYICKANNYSDIILLTKVAGYNICLLPRVHVKVSDITFNIYVFMLIYPSFSVKVLSLLSSDLVKNILSCVFATLYLTQIMFKYDQTVQPNNLRLSVHLFLLSHQNSKLHILCAEASVFVISVSLVSLLLHLDCSSEV